MRKQYYKKLLILGLLAPSYGAVNCFATPSDAAAASSSCQPLARATRTYPGGGGGDSYAAPQASAAMEGAAPLHPTATPYYGPTPCSWSPLPSLGSQGAAASAAMEGAAPLHPAATPPSANLRARRMGIPGAPLQLMKTETLTAYSGNLAPALTILAQVMFASAPHFAELLVEFLEHTFLFESMELVYLTGTINFLALLILVRVCWKARVSGPHFKKAGKEIPPFMLFMSLYTPIITLLSLLCSYFCPISYLWIAKIIMLAPLLLIELCRPPSQEAYEHLSQTPNQTESVLSTIALLLGVVSIAIMFSPVQLPYLSLVLYCISALVFIYGAFHTLDLKPIDWLRNKIGLYEEDKEEGGCHLFVPSSH